MQIWPTGAWFGLSRPRLRVGVWLVALGLTFGLILLAATIILNRRVARDAQAILWDIQKLEVGVSPVSDIDSLASKYARYKEQGHCAEGTCAVFRFYNPWLIRIGRYKTTSLTVQLLGRTKV